MHSDDYNYDDNDLDNYEGDADDDDSCIDGGTMPTDEDDYELEEATTTKEAPEKNCTIMSPHVIRQLQEEDISSISNVFALSSASAITLLLHYKWCVPDVQEEWFADEEKVCKVVGLFDNPVVDRTENTKQKKLMCGICFDAYRQNKMHHAGCSHLYCEACWKGYIGASVNDGPGCLRLRCPDTSCNAAVGQDMVNTFACEESKQKYSSYLLRSYIEDNKNIKWCPAPDCGLAINFIVGSDSSDVTCECVNSFCWKCDMEAHCPVDCSTMEKWILKNNSEAENVRWILVHSKPCPNCKRPIEKRSGCNHMHCSMCNFDFCWICLVSLKNHHCNRYISRDERSNDKSEEKGEARRYLEKYTHYYERWAAHNTSLDQAITYAKNMPTQDELCFLLCPENEEEEEKIKFIKDAWLQIIDCRRVLKWSYTYGYYLPEHEHGKIELFDHVQGEAQSELETLHRYAEEELEICLSSEQPKGNFEIFHKTLKQNITRIVDRFENMVRTFKNSLSEIQSQGAESSNRERAPKDYSSKLPKGAESNNRERASEDYSSVSSDYDSDEFD